MKTIEQFHRKTATIELKVSIIVCVLYFIYDISTRISKIDIYSELEIQNFEFNFSVNDFFIPIIAISIGIFFAIIKLRKERLDRLKDDFNKVKFFMESKISKDELDNAIRQKKRKNFIPLIEISKKIHKHNPAINHELGLVNLYVNQRIDNCEEYHEPLFY